MSAQPVIPGTASTNPVTCVCSVTELLAPSGSTVAAETEAVLVMVVSIRPAERLTDTLTTTDAPLARLAMLHVTVPPDSEQFPKGTIAQFRVAPVGSVSVMTRSAAAMGPLLVMVMA
jgi:hypothetical protein